MNCSLKKFLPLILVVLIILTSMNLHSMVIANKGNNAFNEPDGSKSSSNSMTIEQAIIAGAAYFLAGNSDFLSFLNRVETTLNPEQANYEELKSIIDIAVENLSKAVDAYNSLVEKAEITPYNITFVEKLANFDYKSFKNQRGISGKFFDNLWDLLEAGDVRGVFSTLRVDTIKILEELHGVKTEVDSGKFPESHKLWRLNQLFSETLLFGQYGAEVFYSISGE